MATPESIPQRVLGAIEDAQVTAQRAGQGEVTASLQRAALEVNAWSDWLDEIVYALRHGCPLAEPPSPWHARKRAMLDQSRAIIDLDAERQKRRAA